MQMREFRSELGDLLKRIIPNYELGESGVYPELTTILEKYIFNLEHEEIEINETALSVMGLQLEYYRGDRPTKYPEFLGSDCETDELKRAYKGLREAHDLVSAFIEESYKNSE